MGAYHVQRARLEVVLTEAAEQNGVRIVPGVARDVTRPAPLDQHELRIESPDGTLETYRAPWVVDATGRSGVLARRHRVPDRATSTLALVLDIERQGGWGSDTEGTTIVESFEDGWAWSLPTTPVRRCVTAMLDPPGGGARSTSPDDWMRAALERTPAVRRLVSEADHVGSTWACPASLYHSSSYAEPGALYAGDAGSFIDPLSSFGVKKALSSGWLAGVVVHSALSDAALESDAIAFFDQREADVYRRYRGASLPFFREAAAAYGTQYWVDRRDAAARAASTADVTEAEEGLDPDRTTSAIPRAAVEAAFEELKRREGLDALRPPEVRIVERPGIEGYRIARLPHLVSPECADGIRYVRNVDLIRLSEVALSSSSVPDAWTAYNGVAPPVTLPDYLTALASAFAAGFLRHADPSKPESV